MAAALALGGGSLLAVKLLQLLLGTLTVGEMSEEQRARLEALGYLSPDPGP